MFVEKFDDIKFGKVLTKLYARLYSMEEHKHLPPRFSFAMKDLTEFLGIFEVSEEDLRRQKANNSETSSSISHVTSSAFKQNAALEVVKEGSDSEDDFDSDE